MTFGRLSDCWNRLWQSAMRSERVFMSELKLRKYQEIKTTGLM